MFPETTIVRCKRRTLVGLDASLCTIQSGEVASFTCCRPHRKSCISEYTLTGYFGYLKRLGWNITTAQCRKWAILRLGPPKACFTKETDTIIVLIEILN